MRVLAWIAGALLVLIVAAVATVLVLIERGTHVAVAEYALSTALGRDVSIDSLDVSLGRTLVLKADGLRIANPDWAEDRDAARFERAEIALRAWPLLRGDTYIERLSMRGGAVDVEVADDGRSNWAPAAPAGKVVAPEERADFPAIAQLELRRAQLDYTDRQRDLALRADITATITPDAPDIHVTLNGVLNDRPLAIEFVGGPPAEMRNPQAPYPVDLAITHDRTAATVRGSVDEPLAIHDFNLSLTLEGPSLAAIAPELDLPLPITAPYRLEGDLSREGQVWRFEAFSGTVGGSDLAGRLAVDAGGEKPSITGALTSEELHFQDLAGLVGLDPRLLDGDEKQQQGVFPDTPVNTDRLHSANLEVSLEARKVVAPHLPIEALSTTFTLRDGRLALQPLSLRAVGGGSIEGEAALNARQTPPSADANLVLADVDLRPFFEDTRFIQEMGGSFSGHLYLIGTGRSLAQMMATADGSVSLGIRNARISALIVELIGVDVTEALGLVLTGDTPVPISCGRADLKVRQGNARIERLVVDTNDSTLVAGGWFHLGKETMDIQVEAHAKDFSLIDANAPVRASGPWRDPEIAVGGLDPLPFLEMGEQGNIDCDRLLRGVRDRPDPD